MEILKKAKGHVGELGSKLVFTKPTVTDVKKNPHGVPMTDFKRRAAEAPLQTITAGATTGDAVILAFAVAILVAFFFIYRLVSAMKKTIDELVSTTDLLRKELKQSNSGAQSNQSGGPTPGPTSATN